MRAEEEHFFIRKVSLPRWLLVLPLAAVLPFVIGAVMPGSPPPWIFITGIVGLFLLIGSLPIAIMVARSGDRANRQDLFSSLGLARLDWRQVNELGAAWKRRMAEHRGVPRIPLARAWSGEENQPRLEVLEFHQSGYRTTIRWIGVSLEVMCAPNSVAAFYMPHILSAFPSNEERIDLKHRLVPPGWVAVGDPTAADELLVNDTFATLRDVRTGKHQVLIWADDRLTLITRGELTAAGIRNLIERVQRIARVSRLALNDNRPE